MHRSSSNRPIVGWREWVSLPALGVAHVKAKIDTGARSSALHAVDIKTFRRRGRSMVQFHVHPFQRDSRTTATCEAEVIGERIVKSSSGHRSHRPVIRTELQLLDRTWEIELTLVGREEMGFRMLLGRQALRGFVVDPSKSYRGGVPDGVRKRKKKKKKKKARSPQAGGAKRPRRRGTAP